MSSVGSAQVVVAPAVTPFPLEIKRTPSDFTPGAATELRGAFLRILRKAGAVVPDSATYESALRELRRQDCEREDECLRQLAHHADSLYAIFASIDYHIDGSITAVGRIVREDGKLVAGPKSVNLPRGQDAFADVARISMTQLLDQLRVAHLPAARPVETTGVATSPIAPPAVPPTAKLEAPLRTPGPSTRAIVGYSVAGVGGATAIAGAILAVLANTQPFTLDNQRILASEVERFRGARSQESVGFALAGVGAAAVISGLVVALTDAPAPLALAPGAWGDTVGVVLLGTWP